MSLFRRLLIAAPLLLTLPLAAAQPPPGWTHPPLTAVTDSQPALGVLAENLPFDRLDSLGLSYGVAVDRVLPDSPAQQAGLRAGDILTEIDGQPVYSVSRLRWLVTRTAPDTALTVKVVRDKTPATVSITPRVLKAAPAPAPAPSPSPYPPPPSARSAQAWLGVTLQTLTDGLREAFGTPADTGVLVADVTADSPAAKAGLSAGDVIVKMDRRTVRGADDVRRVLDYFGPGEKVDVDVIRDRKPQTLAVTLGERTQPDAADRAPHDWHHPWAEERPPFIDPGWWRGMQDYMERWQRDWQSLQDGSADGSL